MQDCSQHYGVLIKYCSSSEYECHQVLALSGPQGHCSPSVPCAFCVWPCLMSQCSLSWCGGLLMSSVWKAGSVVQVTSLGSEAKLDVDFADVYAGSQLARCAAIEHLHGT